MNNTANLLSRAKWNTQAPEGLLDAAVKAGVHICAVAATKLLEGDAQDSNGSVGGIPVFASVAFAGNAVVAK